MQVVFSPKKPVYFKKLAKCKIWIWTKNIPFFLHHENQSIFRLVKTGSCHFQCLPAPFVTRITWPLRVANLSEWDFLPTAGHSQRGAPALDFFQPFQGVGCIYIYIYYMYLYIIYTSHPILMFNYPIWNFNRFIYKSFDTSASTIKPKSLRYPIAVNLINPEQYIKWCSKIYQERSAQITIHFSPKHLNTWIISQFYSWNPTIHWPW